MQNLRPVRFIPALVVVCLAVLLVLQMLQFRFGYRLTADDAMFLQFVWHGWDRVWAEAGAVARFSGRIGHYAMTPLNALGAWIVGFSWGRLISLFLYYSVLVLFAVYISRLLTTTKPFVLWAFMVLVLLALHPMAYEHMPPNSYPLQNTLPFLIVVGAKLSLLYWPGRHWLVQALAYSSIAAAMLVNEFVFLFATALMAAGHLANAALPRSGLRQVRVLGMSIHVPSLVSDTVVVAVVLAVYFGFRLQHPSSYEGNDPSGLAEPARFLITGLLHLSAGTVFHRLPTVNFSDVSVGGWLVSGVVALTTTFCAWVLMRRLPVLTLKAAIWILLVTGVLMFYITAPLAATERQQQWCLEAQICGYLDSRVAFPGFAVLAYALVCVFVRGWKGCCRPLMLSCLSCVVGLVAGANHAANSLVASDMRQKVVAWGNAEATACAFGQSRWLTDDQMAGIDPDNRVAMHADMNRRVFWLEYMNFVRDSGACPRGTPDDAAPLVDAFYIHLSSWSSRAESVLGGGWSGPEFWGVWSDGHRSELTLPLKPGVHDDVTAARFQFRPYFGPSLPEQQVRVLIDKKPAAVWRFSQNRHAGDDCCRAVISLPGMDPVRPVSVTFIYEALREPGYPGEGGDVRQLALGLQSVELIEQVRSYEVE